MKTTVGNIRQLIGETLVSEARTKKCAYCSNYTRSGSTCATCRRDEAQAERWKPMVQSFIAGIETPPGWTKTSGDGWHNGFSAEKSSWPGQPWWRETQWVLLTNEDDSIRIAIDVNNGPEMHAPRGQTPAGRRKRAKALISGSGHTLYKNADGQWRTFDRRGVDDSFYLGAYGDNDVNTVVQQQIERIANAKERLKQMLSIPGFGFSIHQDSYGPVKKKLQQGGTHTFTPSGFGIGHRISTNRRTSYSKPLPQETADFFDVKQLWDEQFDHD
jgi:hypothetical protein